MKTFEHKDDDLLCIGSIWRVATGVASMEEGALVKVIDIVGEDSYDQPTIVVYRYTTITGLPDSSTFSRYKPDFLSKTLFVRR